MTQQEFEHAVSVIKDALNLSEGFVSYVKDSDLQLFREADGDNTEDLLYQAQKLIKLHAKS
jgi:hypothetical protein